MSNLRVREVHVDGKQRDRESFQRSTHETERVVFCCGKDPTNHVQFLYRKKNHYSSEKSEQSQMHPQLPIKW